MCPEQNDNFKFNMPRGNMTILGRMHRQEPDRKDGDNYYFSIGTEIQDVTRYRELADSLRQSNIVDVNSDAGVYPSPDGNEFKITAAEYEAAVRFLLRAKAIESANATDEYRGTAARKVQEQREAQFSRPKGRQGNI